MYNIMRIALLAFLFFDLVIISLGCGGPPRPVVVLEEAHGSSYGVIVRLSDSVITIVSARPHTYPTTSPTGAGWLLHHLQNAPHTTNAIKE